MDVVFHKWARMTLNEFQNLYVIQSLFLPQHSFSGVNSKYNIGLKLCNKTILQI